jgi:hypothetical protein
VKPPHRKYRKVQDKEDSTLRGIREEEAGHLHAIRHSRKSLGTLPECRESSPFLHLNKDSKQRPPEI